MVTGGGLAAHFGRPDRMIWVVVGDREQIEPAIRELGLGAIQLIDAGGRPIEEE